jgi:hypothetical protein
MGLDAFVYCDCFERDNLRCSPPSGAKIIVAEDGNILCESPDDEVWAAFNVWKSTKACLHSQMIVAHRMLGGNGLIEQLRAEILKDRARFPLLLRKVLYNGTHTCDWIPLEHLEQLGAEVKLLSEHRLKGAAGDALHLFQIQLAELIIAAQVVKKPICF